jgi:Xaa-Pro aminopeptidase
VNARPDGGGERYAARLAIAREAMRDAGVAAMLVGPGADLRWLTGYAPLPLERLTLLVLPADGPITLLAPRLEAAGAEASPAVRLDGVAVATWEETADPYAAVARALPSGRGNGGTADGAGSHRYLASPTLWALHLLRLQAALPDATWGLATTALRAARMVKDAEEVALLREAAHAADAVVLAIAGGRLVDRTEADVAHEVRLRLVEAGHDEAAFWIVGSGPNSAEPHHEPGDRRIGPGEPIVLDIGGVRRGYCSDTTRTIWVTGGDPAFGPDSTFAGLYGVLQGAHGAAVAAVRPGVPAEAVDAAARDPITAAGYGARFIHRTGHGIGLEGHEEPYLVAGNGEPLAVGHAFSIEPGIYLEGRYGARIEDIVVCGPEAADVLDTTPRDLYVVSGL